ncbi:MAG: hypothetical protein MJZ35_06960 [Bacteroidaceae bacterium]|nr:hypothetical protein [Bacteroidaceae bacterium]
MKKCFGSLCFHAKPVGAIQQRTRQNGADEKEQVCLRSSMLSPELP